MSNIENIILSNLVFNEEYTRKTLPFLKDEYFQDKCDKIVFDLIESFVTKYNTTPTIEALAIDLSNKENVSEDQFSKIKELLSSLEVNNLTKNEWLIDQTEKFVKEKAIYNGIMKSIQILDDKTGKLSTGSIPQILSDALSISFDNHIGHDFLENSDERFDFYHAVESRVPFGLDYLNKITKGGLPNKTLNVALAGTGVGKSLFMCSCAADNMIAGKNVLYITLEMSEERIAERIDANLLNVDLDDLINLTKDIYDRKIQKLKEKVKGKLIIKEYPPACVSAANFRHLINELRLKKNFIPDIIYVDYLNLCTSSRIKMSAAINSYTLVKSIAEELRGIAVEFNLPVVSATQTTRSGFSNSDPNLEDTSESFGLPATCDMMIALISNEELEESHQLMIKQLKNRYSDLSYFRRFVVGIDRAKMRLYDCEESAQDNIMDGGKMKPDKPVMDSGKFMTEEMDRHLPKHYGNSKFKNLDGFK